MLLFRSHEGGVVQFLWLQYTCCEGPHVAVLPGRPLFTWCGCTVCDPYLATVRAACGCAVYGCNECGPYLPAVRDTCGCAVCGPYLTGVMATCGCSVCGPYLSGVGDTCGCSVCGP